MTMDRQDSRSITVDGESYRWLMKSRPSDQRKAAAAGFVVAIEHEAGDGQILAARFDLLNLPGLEARVLSPKDIIRLVRAGLERGWMPRKEGPPLVIRGDEIVR